MIDAEQIREIIATYKKHGWNLSRVLLSGELEKKLFDLAENLFGDAEIVSSEIDAVWFSRKSRNDRIAWEIRLLSEKPFALFESFAADEEQIFVKKTLKEMETRLQNKTS